MLSRIGTTRKRLPPYMVIHGEGGIGKTTFGAAAPKPVFIATEDGQSYVDAQSFGLLKSSAEVLAAIEELKTQEHDRKTVVLDSLDWLEQIIHAEVAHKEGVSVVDDVPYGRGYGESAKRIKEVLLALEGLRRERNMAVIMLAHSEIKPVDSPIKPHHDRLVLKLHKRAKALVMEAVDLVGFAYLDTIVTEEQNGFKSKNKIVSVDAERVVRFDSSDACDCKNRVGMQGILNFDWPSVAAAYAAVMEQAKPQPTKKAS